MNKNNNGDVAEVQYATSTDSNLVDATPNPRLLESLRDMGYDNYQAILDIIDNSVDAVISSTRKKPKIRINTKFGKDGKGRITVIDNGIGMTAETLNQALKLGSETNKERNGELGYFGVGLNSASISLGRGFKIITKHNDGDYVCGIFDLDIAIAQKSWRFVSIEKANASEIKHFNTLTENATTGTVIEIYKLDRISNRNKSQFDTILLKLIGKSYRYHLTGKDKTKQISFTLNDKKVEAIDPMGKDLRGTVLLNSGINKQKYQFAVDGNLVEIVVRYYYVDSGLETVIPSEKVSGRNNGFYVMRNHRQIMSAEKLGFAIDKAAGHLANFRAELLFDGKFDEILKTNVMKSRVILPQSLIDLMKNDVKEAAKYCKSERKKLNPISEEEVSKEVLDDTKSIVKSKNESKTTPTLSTDKTGKPLKKETVEPVDEDDETKEVKERKERKKEIEPREKKTYKKLEVEYVNFGEDSSFFNSYHQGNGKFLLRINLDHAFYGEFSRLDRQGRRFIIDLLHSFTLASRQELYTDELTEIEELIHTWSNFLRRDLNGQE